MVQTSFIPFSGSWKQKNTVHVYLSKLHVETKKIKLPQNKVDYIVNRTKINLNISLQSVDTFFK